MFHSWINASVCPVTRPDPPTGPGSPPDPDQFSPPPLVYFSLSLSLYLPGGPSPSDRYRLISGFLSDLLRLLLHPSLSSNAVSSVLLSSSCHPFIFPILPSFPSPTSSIPSESLSHSLHYFLPHLSLSLPSLSSSSPHYSLLLPSTFYIPSLLSFISFSPPGCSPSAFFFFLQPSFCKLALNFCTCTYGL